MLSSVHSLHRLPSTPLSFALFFFCSHLTFLFSFSPGQLCHQDFEKTPFARSKMLSLTFAALIVAVSALNGIVVPATIKADSEFAATFENANENQYRIYVAAALLGSNGPTCMSYICSGSQRSLLTSRRLPCQLHQARHIRQLDHPRRRRTISFILLHRHRGSHHRPSFYLQQSFQPHQSHGRILPVREQPRWISILGPKLSSMQRV